jgi:prepilin-type N-terminal cleavage/methylation domain-containing protein
MATALFRTLLSAVARFGFGRNRRTGFTLIELIISIAIFSILTGIMTWNFDRYNQSGNVRRGADQIASDLRSIQTKAMTGAPIEGSDLIPIGGYGLHIDLNKSDTQYQLFADRERLDADLTCSAHRNGRLDRALNSTLCLVDSENMDLDIGPVSVLPKDVVIDSIAVDGLSESSIVDVLDIAFQPPKPIATVGVNELTNQAKIETVNIILRHQVTQMRRRVTLVGASGQISVTTPQ